MHLYLNLFFVYHFWLIWDLKMLGFEEKETGILGNKPLGAKERTKNKLDPCMALTPRFKPRPDC